MFQRAVILFFSILYGGDVAWACAIPRPGTFVSLYELAPRSRHIALIKVECEDEKQFEGCVFNDIEVLRKPPEKGYTPLSWRILPLRDHPMWLHSDFIGHTADEFWQEEVGRSPFMGCTFQHDFEPGQTYLIFYDMPAASAAAELILEEEDAWLEYVRGQVEATNFLHMPLAEVSSLSVGIHEAIHHQKQRGQAVPADVTFEVMRAEEIHYEGYSEWLIHSQEDAHDPLNLTVILDITQLKDWSLEQKLPSVTHLRGRLVRIAGMLDQRESISDDSKFSQYRRPHIKVRSAERILIFD